MIGYMVNAIIPLRLGDLVRAYLLGRRHGIAVSTTLSTVVAERLFDVLAIVVIGLLVSTVLDLPPLVEVGLRTFAVIGVAGTCAALRAFVLGGVDRSARLAQNGFRSSALARPRCCSGWTISARRSPCCTTGSVCWQHRR